MKPFISVVIPVYNVAPFIEKCLGSCFDQDVPLQDYEVIVVNDGSTDKSLEICYDLQEKLPPFQIISQKNKGLSGARNTGLRAAKGDYIWFVDSDDWISSNCLSQINKVLKANEPDFVWMGHQVVYQDSITDKLVPKPTEETISSDVFYNHHMANQFYIWKFVYRKEFLSQNGLEFLEGVYYEDLEFTPRVLLAAKKCINFPGVVYNYLIREGSIANKIRDKNIIDRFNILTSHSELLRDSHLSANHRKVLSEIIVHSYCGTVRMAARASIPLPSNAISLGRSLKKLPFVEAKKSLHYKLMALNLPLYYNIYNWIYRAIKK